MSERYDLVVIGGGISGLSMAYQAKEAGLRVLVLEREQAVGGCFDSVALEGDEPFWLEMGTHTCFNSYGRLLKLLDRLRLKDEMAPRLKLSYKMLVDGELYSIPSRLSFVELFTNAWRIFKASKDGKSISDYYRAIVGEKNYRNVFRHAFNAVLCQQADDVPADMLFRKRPRDKSVMRSYTFDGGLSRIIDALEKQVDCRKGITISQLSWLEEQGFSLTTEEGVVHANRLAVATPAPAASRLLKEAFPQIAEQLEWVAEVEIESVGVVVKKEHLSLEPVAGIIAVDGDFYSAVSRDYVDHSSLRGFAFHFKPGLLNDAQKIKRICSLLKLEASQLEKVIHKTNRLPAPDMGHHALMGEVDALLEGQTLALVGNYFKGVAVEDCLERVEKELKRLL